MKLTRAEIPMCPRCGAALKGYDSTYVQWCKGCRSECHGEPHWGYYAPDRELKLLRAVVEAEEKYRELTTQDSACDADEFVAAETAVYTALDAYRAEFGGG